MKRILLVVFLSLGHLINAQVYTFKSQKNGKEITHRILMDATYMVETQFVASPPEFILTRGGFYTSQGETFTIELEFNSDHSKNPTTQFQLTQSMDWKKISRDAIDLNGKWLMAGRVTDEGERRRDTTRPRKTMKFLLDGFFQWIAFNTETMQFFGSGGGYYSAEEGIYTEHIEYFSRNNQSVGRVLPFNYRLNGADWHHEGFSSKGDPMHEIWSFRKQ
ncbi:MAG: hypothetical protein VW080_01065 [Flavobacteriaceae bacterium]